MGDFACAVVKKQQLENIYAPTPHRKEIIIYGPEVKKNPSTTGSESDLC